MVESWVDTSRHNGKLNVPKIKARGFTGIVARCTIGVAPPDSEYARTRDACFQHGMKFGAYGVLWPWNRNPRLEAKHFVAALNCKPHFVVGDFELGLYDSKLSGRTLVDQALEWMGTVADLLPTVPLLFYTAAWYWNSPKLKPFVNRGERRWRVLPASYPYDPRQIPGLPPRYSKDVLVPSAIGPAKPVIPFPWSVELLAGWQWTSKGRGVVDGYQASRFMDRDIIYV
jgi:hypothetical protein